VGRPAQSISTDVRELVPALEARLPQILDEVREHFRADWPDYADFLSHEQDEVVAAASAFLHRLIELVEQAGDLRASETPPSPESPLFEEIGREQWREGRELTTLLSAYQVGARVAWHHVSRAALDLGAEPDTLAALAEAVFIFVDQLSSASARGYVMQQSDAAAIREQLRNELVDLLLSDRADEVAVRGAANRAGWPLPRMAAVILIDPDNQVGQEVLSRLDSSCLLIRRRTVIGAIVPDPVRPGRRTRLSETLRGAGAVVGHPVTLEQLPASMHIAETVVALRHEGLLDEDPVFAAEHLDAIIVHRDPRLHAAFQARMLAALDNVAPAARERLTETLTSWLRHFGDRQAVSAELHIHPQTVRYRMTQLHELMGDVLDAPMGRARLMLALVWNRPPGQSRSSAAGAPVAAAADPAGGPDGSGMLDTTAGRNRRP
jgi:hypothetical protein